MHERSGDMGNTYFQFKEFRIDQAHCAMKVSTDACVFGAWVIEQIRHAAGANTDLLDIGTGTGLLSLMVAQSIESVRVTAVEIDAASASQALENVKASPWGNKIEVIQSDIRSLDTSKKFNGIISNPPFYEGDLTSPDPQKNLAHHDASLRFEELIKLIDRLLADDGILYLLLPPKKIEARINLLSKMNFHIQKQTYLHHSADHPPLRIFLEMRRKNDEPILMDRIDLMQVNGTYSDRIKLLLQDFYLNF